MGQVYKEGDGCYACERVIQRFRPANRNRRQRTWGLKIRRAAANTPIQGQYHCNELRDAEGYVHAVVMHAVEFKIIGAEGGVLELVGKGEKEKRWQQQNGDKDVALLPGV